MSTNATRSRHTIVAVATAALVALSCINAPDVEVIRAADYGPGVLLWEAQARVRNELGARVTHPDTASNWKWTPLRRGWAKVGVFGSPAYGWILRGSATYRNLVGGDSRRRLFCLFHDGDVVRMWDGTESNVVWGYADAPDEPSFP